MTPTRPLAGRLAALLPLVLLAATAAASSPTRRPVHPPPPTDAAITPAAAGAAGAAAASNPAKKDPGGRLVIPERLWNAGRVERGSVVEHVFELRNEGTGPLSIIAKPGCGCTVVDFDKVIPPGGTGRVNARLDTAMFKGDLTKSVTIDSDDPELPAAVLEMRMFVVVALDIQPQDILAFDGKRGEIKPIELTVASPDGVAFDILSAESDDPSYSVKVVAAPLDGSAPPAPAPGTISSGASRHAVTISVAKDVPIGRTGVQVVLKTSHPKAAEVPIQLYPNITGDLEAVPERVTMRLSPGAPAQERSQKVIVRGRGEKTFTVTDVQSSNPLFKATFKTATPQREYVVTISYEGPPLATTIDGHVNIVTDDAEQPVLPIVVYAFPEPQQPSGHATPAGAR